MNGERYFYMILFLMVTRESNDIHKQALLPTSCLEAFFNIRVFQESFILNIWFIPVLFTSKKLVLFCVKKKTEIITAELEHLRSVSQ